MPLFQGCTPAEISALAARAQLRRFNAGSVVLKEGSALQGMYIVYKGKVAVTTAATNRKHGDGLQYLDNENVARAVDVGFGADVAPAVERRVAVPRPPSPVAPQAPPSAPALHGDRPFHREGTLQHLATLQTRTVMTRKLPVPVPLTGFVDATSIDDNLPAQAGAQGSSPRRPLTARRVRAVFKFSSLRWMCASLFCVCEKAGESQEGRPRAA